MILKQYKTDCYGNPCENGDWYKRHVVCDKCNDTIIDETKINFKEDFKKKHTCNKCKANKRIKFSTVSFLALLIVFFLLPFFAGTSLLLSWAISAIGILGIIIYRN